MISRYVPSGEARRTPCRSAAGARFDFVATGDVLYGQIVGAIDLAGRAMRRQRAGVLGVIAAGGVLGAEARYGISLFQPGSVSFPWATLVVNVLGCLLIGVLMATLTELSAAHPLIRPFLGVGVLGGFTTFSTYAVEVQAMLVQGRYSVAVLYLVTTPVIALAATASGLSVTRAALGRLRRRRGRIR